MGKERKKRETGEGGVRVSSHSSSFGGRSIKERKKGRKKKKGGIACSSLATSLLNLGLD